MIMTDVILGIVILLIVGVAVLYIRNEKKKGVTCIGCPLAAACARKNSGCGGHTEIE